jgi:hypothetical protein
MMAYFEQYVPPIDFLDLYYRILYQFLIKYVCVLFLNITKRKEIQEKGKRR